LDTVNWLRRQPWCNGKIGTWGGSAVGITQLLLAGAGTAPVTCQHITVGAPSLYHDTVWPGGVFKKSLVEDWLRLTKFNSNALVIWTSHPNHDAYWQNRELNGRYCHVNAPAVHIGGWFDIFAQGTLDAFNGYQNQGGKLARGRQRLLMGPWTHGVLQEKAGEFTFPGAKKPPTLSHDAWKWYDYQLRGLTNGLEREPAVTYYVMGDVSDTNAPGNIWRTANHWPPVPAKPTWYYLQADRSLQTRRPHPAAPLTFIYDPQNPAPTVGGPQLTLPAGPKDQQSLETRADVLVFTSEPLDKPLEVTGRVRVRLYAASDAPDTDFFAKLCDVYPDGRSFNICEGQLRARHRRSFAGEAKLKPGRVYPFDIDLWSTSIVFNRGHRLRVSVTSSSAPGFDPNPNTGEPFRANSRTQVAHNQVYLDAAHPSGVLLPLAMP
jgi:putative CocE/NonD family hydrolase